MMGLFRKIAGPLAITAGLLFSSMTVSAADDGYIEQIYKEGEYFYRISTAETNIADLVGGGDSVVMVVSYTSKNSLRLDKKIAEWAVASKKAGAEIKVVRVPNLMGSPIDELLGKYLLAAADLRVTGKIHGLLYMAGLQYMKLPKESRPPLRTFDAQVKELIVSRLKIDPRRLDLALKSTATQKRRGRALKIIETGKVVATPALIINGQYLVDVKMRAGLAKIFSVVNHLLERSQWER